MNSVKLINYIQPTGEYITFFSELDSELKVGDKVFIVGGNYDNTVYTDKDSPRYDIYHPYATGYKVVSVDNTDNSNAITLNIKYSDAIFNKDGINTVIFNPLPVYNDTQDIKEAYLSKSYFKRGEFLGGKMSGIFGNIDNEEDSLFNNKFSNTPAEAENMIFVGGKFNWGYWKNIWNKDKKGKKQTLNEFETPKNPRDETKFNIVGFSDNNGGFGYSYLVNGSVGKIYESLHNFNVSSDGVLYFLDYLPYSIQTADLNLFKLTFEIDSNVNKLRYEIKSVDLTNKSIEFESESKSEIFRDSTFRSNSINNINNGVFTPRMFKLYVADSENIKNNINGVTGLSASIYSTTMNSTNLLGGNVYGGTFKSGIAQSNYKRLDWYNGIVDGKKDATFFENINWKDGIFKDGNWRGDSVVSIKNYTINSDNTFTVSIYKRYKQLFETSKDVFISYIKRSISDSYFDNFTEYPTKKPINFGTFNLRYISDNTSNNLFTDLILDGTIDSFDSEVSLINSKISQSEFIKGEWLNGKWESGIRKNENKIIESIGFIKPINDLVISIITTTTGDVDVNIPTFDYQVDSNVYTFTNKVFTYTSNPTTDTIETIYLDLKQAGGIYEINKLPSFAAKFPVERIPETNHIILAKIFIPKSGNSVLMYDYFKNYRDTKEVEMCLVLNDIESLYVNKKVDISNIEIVKKIELGIIDGTVNDNFNLDDRGTNSSTILTRSETLNTELVIKSVYGDVINDFVANVIFVNTITPTDSNLYIISENILDIRPIHNERVSELTDSVWIDGEFNSGVWDGGIFRNGNIRSKLYFDQTDINNQIVFKNGYLKDGIIDNSTILSSTIEKGTINNKTIISNYNKDMVIYDATINDVEYRRGLLKKATVNGGKFIGGSLENVNFIAGQYTNGFKTFDNTYNTNRSGKLTPDNRWVDISAPSFIYIDGDGWVQLDQPSYYQTDYNVIFKDLTLFPNPLEGQMFDIRDKDDFGTRLKIDYKLANIPSYINDNPAYLSDDFKDLKPIVAVDNMADFAQISENVFWVADSTNKRILIIDYNTKKVNVLGKIGLLQDLWNFGSINFISAPLKYKNTDAISNVYVVDNNTRIRRFNLNGDISFEYTNILNPNETIISIDSIIAGKTEECSFYLTSNNRILYTIGDEIKELVNVSLINMSQISSIRRTTSNSIDMFVLNNNTISHIVLDLSAGSNYIIRQTSPYRINGLENEGVVIKTFTSTYNESNIELYIIYENVQTYNDVVKFIYSEYYTNKSNIKILLNDTKLEYPIYKSKISQISEITSTKELLSILIVNNSPVVLASSSLSKNVIGFANIFSTTRLHSFTENNSIGILINSYWVYDDLSDRIIYVNEALPNLYDSEIDVDTTLSSDNSRYIIHKMVNSESNNAIYSIQTKESDNSYSIRRTERGITDSNNEKIYTIEGVSKIFDIVYNVDKLYVLCQDSSTKYKIFILDTVKLINNLQDVQKYDLNINSTNINKLMFDIVNKDGVSNVMLVTIKNNNKSDIYKFNLDNSNITPNIIYENYDEIITGVVIKNDTSIYKNFIEKTPIICFLSFRDEIIKVMTDINDVWSDINNTVIYYKANNQIADISKDRIDSNKIIVSVGTNFVSISSEYLTEENIFDSFIVSNNNDILGISHNRLIKYTQGTNISDTVKHIDNTNNINITIGVYDINKTDENVYTNNNFLLRNARSIVKDSFDTVYFIDSDNKIRYYVDSTTTVYGTIDISFPSDYKIVDLCFYNSRVYFMVLTPTNIINTDNVNIYYFTVSDPIVPNVTIQSINVLAYNIPSSETLKKFSICPIPSSANYLVAILTDSNIKYGIYNNTTTNINSGVNFVNDITEISDMTDISLVYNTTYNDIKMFLTESGVLKFIPYNLNNSSFDAVNIEEVENSNEYITSLNEQSDTLSIYDKLNNNVRFTQIILSNRNSNITIIDFAVNPNKSIKPKYYFVYVTNSGNKGIIRQPAEKTNIDTSNILYDISTNSITKLVVISDNIVFGYSESNKAIYKYDFSTNKTTRITEPNSEDSKFILKARDISHYTESSNNTSLLIIYEYFGPYSVNTNTGLFSVYTYTNTMSKLEWLYIDNKPITNMGVVDTTVYNNYNLKYLFNSALSPKIYGGYTDSSPYIMLYFGQFGNGRFLKLTNKIETETLNSTAYNDTILKLTIPTFNKDAETINSVYVNDVNTLFGINPITIGSDQISLSQNQIWIQPTNIITSGDVDIKIYTTLFEDNSNLSNSRISEFASNYEQGIYDFRVYEDNGNKIKVIMSNQIVKIDTSYLVSDFFELNVSQPSSYAIYEIRNGSYSKLLKNAVIPTYTPANTDGTIGIFLDKLKTDIGLVAYNTENLPLLDNTYIFRKIIKGYKVVDTNSKSVLSPYLTARVLYNTIINQNVSYNSLGSIYTAHLVSSKWNNPNTFLGTWDQPRYVNNQINPVYSVFMKGIFEGDFYDGFFIGGEFRNNAVYGSRIWSGHFISDNDIKISSGSISNNWRYDVHGIMIDNNVLTIKTEGIFLDEYTNDYSNYPISEIGKNSYIRIPNIFNEINVEVYELRTYRIDVNGKKEIVLLVKDLDQHLISVNDKIFIESHEYTEYLFGEFEVLNIFKKDDISYITINSELPYFTNNSYVPKLTVKIKINSLNRVIDSESYKEGSKFYTNLKIKLNTDLTDIKAKEALFFKPSITIINNNVVIPAYTQLFNTSLTKSENVFESHFSDKIKNVLISNIKPKNVVDPSIVEIASSSVIAHDIMVSESKVIASRYDKNSWIENSIILSGQIFSNLRTTSVLNLDSKGFSNNKNTSIGDSTNSYIFEGDNTEILNVYFDTNRYLWIEMKNLLFNTDKYRYITLRGFNGKNSTMIGNTRSIPHRILEVKNNLIKIANPFVIDPNFNFDYLTLQSQNMLLKDQNNVAGEIRTTTGNNTITFNYSYASQAAMNGGDFYGDFYGVWNKGNFRKGNFYGKWFGSPENRTSVISVQSDTTKNSKGGYTTKLNINDVYDFTNGDYTGLFDYLYVSFNSFFNEGNIIESIYGSYYGIVSYDGDNVFFEFNSEFNIPNQVHSVTITKYRYAESGSIYTKLLTDFNANIKTNYNINDNILESSINYNTIVEKTIELNNDKGIILNTFETGNIFAVSMLFRVSELNKRNPLFSFLNSKNGFAGIRTYVDTDGKVNVSYTLKSKTLVDELSSNIVIGEVSINTWYHILINIKSDISTNDNKVKVNMRALGGSDTTTEIPIANENYIYLENYDINFIGKDFVIGSDKSVNTYVYKGFVDEFVVWNRNIDVAEIFNNGVYQKIINKNIPIISTFIDSELTESNYYPRQSDYYSLSSQDTYTLGGDYTYSKDNVFLDIDIFIEQASVITTSLDEYKILTVEERRYVDNIGSEYVYTLELIITELDKNRFNFVIREKVCYGDGRLFYPVTQNGLDKSKDKVFDSKIFNFYNNFNIVLSDSELYIDGISLGKYNLVNRNVFKATNNTKIILGKYDIGKISNLTYLNPIPSITGFIKNINIWERSENTTYLTYRIFSGENTDSFTGNITDTDSKNLQIPYFNSDGTNTWSKLVYSNESNFSENISDKDIVVNSEYTKTALPDPEWLSGSDYKKLDTSIDVIPIDINDIEDANYMLTQSNGSDSIIISNMGNFRFFSKQVVANSNDEAFLNVSASGYVFFTNLFNGTEDLLRYPHFSYSDNASDSIYNYVNTEDAIMFNSIIDIRDSFNGGVEYVDRENEFIIKFYGKSTNIESKLNAYSENVHQYTNNSILPESTIPDSFYAIRLDKINSNITFYIRRIGKSNDQKILGLKRSDGLWNYINDSDPTKNFYYKQSGDDIQDSIIGMSGEDSDDNKYSNNTEYIVFVPRFNVKDVTNEYITHIANKDYDYLKQYGISVKKQFNARGLGMITLSDQAQIPIANIDEKYYDYSSSSISTSLVLIEKPIVPNYEYPLSEQYDITNKIRPLEMSYYEKMESVNRDSFFYSGNFSGNVWYNGIFVDGIINTPNFIWKYGIKHNGTLSGTESLENYAHWLGGYHYGESDKSFLRNLIWNRGLFVGGNWESGYWMSLDLSNVYDDTINLNNKKDKWSIFRKGEWSSINNTIAEVSTVSNLFTAGNNGTFTDSNVDNWNLTTGTVGTIVLSKASVVVDDTTNPDTTKDMCMVVLSTTNSTTSYLDPLFSFEGTDKIFVKRNTVYTVSAKTKIGSDIGGIKIEAYTDVVNKKLINISNIGYEKISTTSYQYNVLENVNYYNLVAEDNLVNISHTFDSGDNDYVYIKTSTYGHSINFTYYIDDIQMMGVVQQSDEFDPYDLKNHSSVWSGGTFISDQVKTGIDNFGIPTYAKYSYQSNVNKLYRVKNNQTLTLPKVESIMLGGLWLRGVVDGGILANMFFHSTKSIYDNTATSIYESDIKHNYDISASKFLKGKLLNSIWYGGTVYCGSETAVYDKREVIFGDLLNFESDLNHNDISLSENSNDIYAYNFKRSDFSDAYNKTILGRDMFDGYHYNTFNDGTPERILEIENSRVYNQYNNDGIYGVYIKRISFKNGIIQFSEWDSLDLDNVRQNVISESDNEADNRSIFKKGFFYSSTFNAGLAYACSSKTMYPLLKTDEPQTLFYYSHWKSGYWKAVGLKNNNDPNSAYYSSLDTTDNIEITNALFSRGVWDSGVFEGGVMDLSIWRSGVNVATNMIYKNSSSLPLILTSSTSLNKTFYINDNNIGSDPNSYSDYFEYGISGTNILPLMENNSNIISTINSKPQYRRMGNVDNLASIFVNGHMRGCVWHGGTFMRGIFEHKDNNNYDFFDRLNGNKFNIGIWNRGLWLSGYFSHFDETWIDTANNTSSYLYYKNNILETGRRSLFMSINAINVTDNTTILGMNNTSFDNLVDQIVTNKKNDINNYASLFSRRLLKERTESDGTTVIITKKPYFSLMNGSFFNGIIYQSTSSINSVKETEPIFSAYATITNLYHKSGSTVSTGSDILAFQTTADYSKSNIDKFKIPYKLTPIIFGTSNSLVYIDETNTNYITPLFNNGEQNGINYLNSSNLHKWRHNYDESISTFNVKIGDGTIVNGVNGLREMTIGTRIVQISIAQGAGITYLETSDAGEPKYEGDEQELADINRYFSPETPQPGFFSGSATEGGFFTPLTPLP